MKHLDLFLSVPDVIIIALQYWKYFCNSMAMEGGTDLKETFAIDFFGNRKSLHSWHSLCCLNMRIN